MKNYKIHLSLYIYIYNMIRETSYQRDCSWDFNCLSKSITLMIIQN